MERSKIAATLSMAYAVLALSSCSANPQDLCDNADSLSAHGKYTTAIKLYDEAIRLSPNVSRFYLNRGIAYDQLKQYERAHQDFDKALELCASDDEYRKEYFYNRAMCFHRLKKYSKAVDDYNQAVSLSPSDPSFLAMRARSEMMLGKYQDALDDLNRSVTLHSDPDEQASSLFQRGLTYKAMHKEDDAVKNFSQSIELYEKGFNGDVSSLRGSSHKLPAAYWERGNLLKKQGKDALGAADLKRASDLNYRPDEEHRLPVIID